MYSIVPTTFFSIFFHTGTVTQEERSQPTRLISSSWPFTIEHYILSFWLPQTKHCKYSLTISAVPLYSWSHRTADWECNEIAWYRKGMSSLQVLINQVANQAHNLADLYVIIDAHLYVYVSPSIFADLTSLTSGYASGYLMSLSGQPHLNG